MIHHPKDDSRKFSDEVTSESSDPLTDEKDWVSPIYSEDSGGLSILSTFSLSPDSPGTSSIKIRHTSSTDSDKSDDMF